MFPIGNRGYNIYKTYREVYPPPEIPVEEVERKPAPKKRLYRYVINAMDNRLQSLPNIDPLVNVYIEAFRVYDHGWFKSHLDLNRYFPSIGKELYDPSASILISFYHRQYEFESLVKAVFDLKCINQITIYPHTKEAIDSAFKFRESLLEYYQNKELDHLSQGVVNIKVLLDTSYLYEIKEFSNIDYLIRCPRTLTDFNDQLKFLNNIIDGQLKPNLFIEFEEPNIIQLHAILTNPYNNFKSISIFNFRLYNETEIEEYFYNKGYISSDHRDIALDQELDMALKAELINKRIIESKEGKTKIIVKPPAEKQSFKRKIPDEPVESKRIQLEEESDSEEDE